MVIQEARGPQDPGVPVSIHSPRPPNTRRHMNGIMIIIIIIVTLCTYMGLQLITVLVHIIHLSVYTNCILRQQDLTRL